MQEYIVLGLSRLMDVVFSSMFVVIVLWLPSDIYRSSSGGVSFLALSCACAMCLACASIENRFSRIPQQPIVCVYGGDGEFYWTEIVLCLVLFVVVGVSACLG